MYKTKDVYVITAFFADYQDEDRHYSDPSEEFYADTYEAAKERKLDLMSTGMYDDVTISEDKETREFL